MKVLLTLALATCAAVGMRTMCGDCCSLTTPETDIEPAGTYVEARTASVFAGACHYNSELVTAGREALLALCLVVLLAGSFGYHLFLLASYVGASSSPAVLAALAAK